jgi:putative transposase
MNDTSSLNHSRWECKYHIVWIPKYRRKILYGQLRKYLGQIFKDLAQNRESEVLEGHMMSDHVHMLISIPPKYSVAQIIGYIKGKSAIPIVRNYLGHRENYTGEQFWARGYHVSTVGRDEEAIREYIKTQEAEDRRLEQLTLFK